MTELKDGNGEPRVRMPVGVRGVSNPEIGLRRKRKQTAEKRLDGDVADWAARLAWRKF